jgi:hypothetical protein
MAGPRRHRCRFAPGEVFQHGSPIERGRIVAISVEADRRGVASNAQSTNGKAGIAALCPAKAQPCGAVIADEGGIGGRIVCGAGNCQPAVQAASVDLGMLAAIEAGQHDHAGVFTWRGLLRPRDRGA